VANDSSQRAHWSSRFVFILAAVGSAVGLGNIWKFPYIAGVNGGGAFVLIYLLCIAVVGIPIFIAELYIGQQSQKNAVQAFEELTHKKSPWRFVGLLGVVGAALILSFYSVVGGWVLDFGFRALMNEFANLDQNQIKSIMTDLFQDPYEQIFWHFIFMGITVAIVMGGIKKGIERWNKILMPTLFFLLIFLLIKAVMMSGFNESLNFLFSFNASKLTASGILEALGHAFFYAEFGDGHYAHVRQLSE